MRVFLICLLLAISGFCEIASKFHQVYPLPPFDCPALSPAPPATDVTHLRPSDIKVMMALGDSITAGFGMQGILPREFEEWRGYVYSIGGEEGAYTMANFIKQYSPSVQGLAQGNTWPLTPGAWLDAAVSMAQVQEISPQIDYLVTQLQTTYKDSVNFNDDWKLLTLFIGANNLCPSCHGSAHSPPEFFEANLKSVLQQIEQQIPRTFVNLITIFNISGVWYAGQTSDYCRILWDGITNGECPCLTTGNVTNLEIMDDLALKYNQISENLAAQFQAMNNPNFTVVIQPGLSGIEIAKFGEDYLSALDCFHPNAAANEAFSYQLWNNMMTPPGKKSTAPDFNNLAIICPDEGTYLQ